MQNWAVEFHGVAEKISIVINRNGSDDPPKSTFNETIIIEQNSTLMRMKSCF